VGWKQGLLFVVFGAPLNFWGAQLSHRVSAGLLLVFFGVLMGVCGAAMLIKRTERKESATEPNIWPVVASGPAVGFLAGFLGVGGSFMIVPSLVLFLRMPIKTATGTSLFVITANSAVALFGHRQALDVGWIVLLELVPPALVATYLGVRLAQKLSAHQLRKIFGRIRHPVGRAHGCLQHCRSLQTLRGLQVARQVFAACPTPTRINDFVLIGPDKK
jgi:uncharacterized membrane protein YfcA